MKKKKLIKEIKSIIQEWGSTSVGEMELESSPVFLSPSKGHIMLIEQFNPETVTIVTYIHESEVDDHNVSYEELDYDILFEVHGILDRYSVAMSKTMDKCRDENWD